MTSTFVLTQWRDFSLPPDKKHDPNNRQETEFYHLITLSDFYTLAAFFWKLV